MAPFFHQELAYEVSREAVLLYVYAYSMADARGICEGVRRAGSFANLTRQEAERALNELVEHGFVSTVSTEVPIAEFSSGAVVMGSRLDLKIEHFTTPLQSKRLSAEAWASLRAEVFERDDFTCQYCGSRGGRLECDHVEPISKGGTNELGNLVTACGACNKKKRAKLLQEWRSRESA